MIDCRPTAIFIAYFFALEKSVIKTIGGFIPICANCKKIRDENGCWATIDHYITDYTEHELSHGICPECKEKHTPKPDLLARLGLDQKELPFTFYRGKGCSKCGNLGFKGRTVIEEVMIMGRKIRELIQSGATTDQIREAAMATGMTTLGISGLKKIEEGITTIDEVLKAVQQKEELTTICLYCGKGVSLDFRDCPYCKKPLVPTCSSCSRIVQTDWVVCPHCRNDLQPPSETTSSRSSRFTP